jgi:hypothetical protein
MKKLLWNTAFLFLTSILLGSLDVQAQSIFTNPITGTNPNTDNPYTAGQSVDPNLTVSGIGRGPGITGNNANDRYNANNWNSVSLDSNKYFEFTLTPISGYQINFVSFAYTGQASGTGPTNVAFRSSLDGFSANIGSPTIAGTTLDLSAPVYQSITTPITFRFYAWGASAGAGTFSINNFTFNGTVSSIIPLAPIITSELTASGLVSQPFNYTITADNFPTSFSATGLPPGLSVNTSTGVISGTPTATGTYFVVVEATNASGTDSQTLIITVTDPGPEINIRGATGGTNNIISANIVPNAFNNTLFGTTPLGGFIDKDFRIQNLGTNDLLLSGTPIVEITGPHAGDFSVTTLPATTIAPGGDSVFVIRFTPTDGGVRNATVSIINNDSDENPYTFAIQGTCLAPNISVIGNGNIIPVGSTTPTLANHTNFGNANIVAGSRVRSFYLLNIGGADLEVSSVTISGIHAADFTITTTPAATVTTNNTTTLGITFQPTALGLREALVTINNNVVGKNPYTFAISGVGIDFDECQLGANSEIWRQFFDSPGAGWNYTVTTLLGANPPVVTGGTAFGNSRTTTINKFVTTGSFQVTGPYPTTSDLKAKTILTFDAVDASAHREVFLEFLLGAYSTNGSQGLDISDWVTVSVSVDGGTTWTREAIIKGNSNSIWSVTTGGSLFDNPFKGFDIPYEVNSNSNSVGNGVRRFFLRNLPEVANLQIRIEFDVDREDEIWVLDSVRLQGRLPSVTTWNGTAWNFGAPTSTVAAVFGGNYNTTTHGNVTACECRINAARTVTVTPGSYLELGGRIVNNGNLIIENNGSVVQKDDYAVNSGTGNTTVRRIAQIRRQDYVYWSSPVQNFPVLSVSPGTPAAVVWKWIPTIGGNFGNWTNANENMVPGKGYIVRGPSSFNNTTIQPLTAIFTGVLHNGIVQTTVERGDYQGAGYPSPTNPLVTVLNTDDNMNLIGNPYPSAIRAIDFLNANPQLEGAVRIWTHGSLPATTNPDPFYNSYVYNYAPTDYIIYNSSGVSTGPMIYNGFIPSGQGFFVVKQDGPAATSQVVFNNKMRSATYDNSQFFRMQQPEADDSLRPVRIWLDLIPASGAPYRTLVAYVEGATNEQDRLFDAALTHGGFALFSVQYQNRLSIQGRALPFESTDQVPLGYRTLGSGNYTLAIAHLEGLPEGVQVYVLDTQTGIEHLLNASPYTFYATAGEFHDRLVLKYQQQTLSLPGITETPDAVVAMSAPGQIAVKSISTPIKAVEVYDITGRRLLQSTLLNVQEAQLPLSNLRQGLLVRVTLTDGRVYHQKLIH